MHTRLQEESKKLTEAAAELRKRLPGIPDVAVVLGTGLGGFAEQFPTVVPYTEVPWLVPSTVSGHRGAFAMGAVGGKKVLAMTGRVHYYEGYTAAEVVRPVRVMAMTGVKKLILTNVSGGIDESLPIGFPVMLSGHIASLMPSPLRGRNVDELGVRFPDMSEVYSRRIRNIAKEIYADLGMEYREGVYIQAPGPQYETPEEIAAFRIWGADMVGMSTAIEAIAARHAGMEVAAVSLISNPAAGIGKHELNHEEVKAAAAVGAQRFNALLTELIRRI